LANAQIDIACSLNLATQSAKTLAGSGSTSAHFKWLAEPFFGAGLVEVDPGCYKTKKNSSRMQLVFFVHVGKVLVTVANSEFRVGKGGMWQVPRGKLKIFSLIAERR
jgi:centromere protein C